MTTPSTGAFSNDAYEIVKAMLAEWGLSDLNDVVNKMMVEGVSSELVPLRIRETDAYKKRFAGNEVRRKQGLPPLSEADYLNTETALKDVARRWGMTNQSVPVDTEKWIGADVSAQELNDRFSAYQKQYVNQPQWVKDAWASHGLTPQDAMVAVMDPKTSDADLTRRLDRFAIGSEALQAYGNSYTFDQNSLDDYANKGVTADQARQGFSDVAAREGNESFLANLSGQTLTRQEQEKSALLKDAQVDKKRDTILNEEKNRFQENFLGAAQGALSKNTSGQY